MPMGGEGGGQKKSISAIRGERGVEQRRKSKKVSPKAKALSDCKGKGHEERGKWTGGVYNGEEFSDARSQHLTT